jgi:hypothetical protein
MRNGISAGLLCAALALAAGCETRVWWLTADGVFLRDARSSEPTAVSLPGWIRSAAASSCPPALALGPRGEAVVTSNVVPTLWRIDPRTLAVTEHPLALDADLDRDVGFSGLAYSREDDAYFAVSSAHGSLWRIDSELKRAAKLGGSHDGKVDFGFGSACTAVR